MKKLSLLITSAFIMNAATEVSTHASNGNQPVVPVVPVATAPLKGTCVTFPTNFNSNIDYYGEENGYPYVYYGGYFWYPKTEATVLNGYTPTYWNGYYWYASRIHPHHVYVEKQDALYLLPLEPKGILE